MTAAGESTIQLTKTERPKVMEHYVCPVCGGVSDHAKNCETAGCPLRGKPLMKCACEDGEHSEVKKSAPQSSGE